MGYIAVIRHRFVLNSTFGTLHSPEPLDPALEAEVSHDQVMLCQAGDVLSYDNPGPVYWMCCAQRISPLHVDFQVHSQKTICKTTNTRNVLLP